MLSYYAAKNRNDVDSDSDSDVAKSTEFVLSPPAGQANGQRNVTWLQWKTGNWFSVTNCKRGRYFPVEFECVFV